MQGPARFLGHSLHPALIAFPLGLLTCVPICDVIHMAGHVHVFGPVAFWMLSFGIIGAIAAAIPGVIDYLSIPSGTRAARVGLLHAFVNTAAAGLFILSWWARLFAHLPDTHWAPFVLALAGTLVLWVGGWLGGELVQRHLIGVADDASLNAHSSLARPGHREIVPPGPGPQPRPRHPQPI